MASTSPMSDFFNFLMEGRRVLKTEERRLSSSIAFVASSETYAADIIRSISVDSVKIHDLHNSTMAIIHCGNAFKTFSASSSGFSLPVFVQERVNADHSGKWIPDTPHINQSPSKGARTPSPAWIFYFAPTLTLPVTFKGSGTTVLGSAVEGGSKIGLPIQRKVLRELCWTLSHL